MDTAGDERDGRGAAGRRGDGRERVCRLGRQWLERWGRRWRGPCGLSGLESSRAGLWWYTSELQRCAGHRERGRLERWRAGRGQRRRGEPGVCTADVAGNADPQTGYQVRVDGTDLVIGGTSAVAPLWAALIARIGQSSGRAAG